MNAEPIENSLNNSSYFNSQQPDDCNISLSTAIFPAKRGFKLASLNIASLMKHIDELRILLADCPVDVLSINETKLDNSIQDCEVYIPGYEIVRRDRNRNGGGVCFYIRRSITFTMRNDLKMENLENLCIEIRKPQSKPFVVVNWYRPPNSPVELFTSFESLIGQIDTENVEYYLMGDFNCDLTDGRHDAQYDNNNARILSNITNTYGLQQLINEPTRITNSTSTLIDLIYTNYPERVVCSGVSHCSISDHSLIYVYRKLSIGTIAKDCNNIIYRSFKNFNRDNFRSDILSQDWNNLSNTQDPNTMWVEWKKTFLSIADKHAPIRSKRVRSKSSPLKTSELKKRMHERNIAKIKAKHSNDPSDWRNFKRTRNTVNSEIKLAKESYYKNAFIQHSGNSRKIWQTINDLTARKQNKTEIKEIKLDGVSITNPSDLSNLFNEHFSTIGPKLANEIPSPSNNSNATFTEYLINTDKRFQFTLRNNAQVLLLLNKLCKSKATGLDKISARLIRECADLISNSITNIFNASLTLGIFPEDWKCAKVTPIFKQGARNELNNYRPISVISVIAKVFERIIYNQLYTYMIENDLMVKHQSGFRSMHSTVMALLEATDTWAYNIDRGNVNAVIFLDLKKAFDTVNYEILLCKLQNYGIHGIAFEWFKSYLENRTQKCFVNGSLSENCSLKCGIPQGTILGPLMFLVFINDLPNCNLSDSQPRMYADDTNLTYAGNDIYALESKLNQDLENVNEWLISNKLTLNMTKTEYSLC